MLWTKQIRRLGAMLAVLSCLPLAACGEDGEESGPSEITIVEREVGSKLEFEIDGEARPGLTRIIFRNQTRKPHSAQLVQVTGGQSQSELISVYKALGAGKAIPDWFVAGGGAGSTAPGTETRVTQELSEGTYYVVDDEDEDNPASGGVAKLEVAGEVSKGSLPSGGKVIAEDYAFTATGLKAGRNTVVLTNAGKEPHHLAAVPILPGKTIADVREFLERERRRARPPADFTSGVSTAVLAGGKSLATTLALRKGKYALLCFISDRKGGPPHVAKGMISEATVE